MFSKNNPKIDERFDRNYYNCEMPEIKWDPKDTSI
jgi:hypothetical protein